MIEDIGLLVFCFLLAIGGLVTVVWEVWGLLTGRALTIDSVWLALISLTLATVFGGNIAWSMYTGELPRILKSWHKGSTTEAAPDATAAGQK